MARTADSDAVPPYVHHHDRDLAHAGQHGPDRQESHIPGMVTLGMAQIEPGTERNARELDLVELAHTIAARKRRELRKNGAVVARARRITRGGREHIGDRTVDRDATTLTYLEHPDGTRELAVGARPDLSGWRSPSGIVSAVVVESRSRAARADRAQTELAAQHTAKLAARRLVKMPAPGASGNRSRGGWL